jgi:hypothetical protein
MFNTPILLILFNKAEESLRVFEAIRSVRPLKLFIAQDAPRPDKPTDVEQCRKVRAQILQSIDWSCEVHTLFQESNLGCKYGPMSAISWFFDHVEHGIILEDDCLPSQEFFFFCWELLQRYANDPRISVISGNCFLPSPPTSDSYFFFNIPQTWGWASWRRAWRLYDPSMKVWPQMRATNWLTKQFSNPADVQYWTAIFDMVYTGKLATAWDYQWTFTSMVHDMVAINPSANLVTNIGLGVANATHTADPGSQRLSIPHQPLEFPLRHPTQISINPQAAEFLYRFCFRG